MISRLTPAAFSWSRWRRFNLFTCRYDIIISFKNVIRKYAVGYIEGEFLQCRPKPGLFAILFLKDGEFSWCHITDKEFKKVFEEFA